MSAATKKTGWVAYVCYKLRAEYKVMAEANRFQLAAFLVDILESPHDNVDVDCYCSIGFRSDVDFFVRYEAPTPQELQEICVKVNNSGLGRYLETTHDWLARYKESPYAAGDGAAGEDASPDFFVLFPFVQAKTWYGLGAEERGRMMRDHVKVAHEHPSIHATVAYSHGIGDQECVFGFEVGNLEEFEELAGKLRETEVSQHAAVHQPVIVGTAVTAHEALELCGAL